MFKIMYTDGDGCHEVWRDTVESFEQLNAEVARLLNLDVHEVRIVNCEYASERRQKPRIPNIT